MIHVELRARASQRLDESGAPTFYPAAEITAALNEALRFFALLTLCLEATRSWNVPAATTFFHMLAYFPDWIVPLRITTANGAKVRPARLEDLDALNQRWQASPGAPERYAALGADFLALYKQPAAAGTVLSVTYARGPVRLVNDTDVPEIPEQYHPELVKYAIYRLRQVEGGQEFAKTLDGFKEFMAAARVYADYVRARNLGSRYDAVPVELKLTDKSNLYKFRPDVVPARSAE